MSISICAPFHLGSLFSFWVLNISVSVVKLCHQYENYHILKDAYPH